MSFPFEQLPLEIQAQILQFEDPGALGQLCQADSNLRRLCQNELLWKQKFAELTRTPNVTQNDPIWKQNFFQMTQPHPNQNNHFIPNSLATTWLERVRVLWMLTHPKTIVRMSFSGNLLKNYITDSVETAKTCAIENYNQGMKLFDQSLLDVSMQFLNHHSKFIKGMFFDLYPSNTSLTLISTELHPSTPIFTIPGNNKTLMYELILLFYNYPGIVQMLENNREADTGPRYIQALTMEIALKAKKTNLEPHNLTVKDIETLLSLLGRGERYKIVELPLARCPYVPGPVSIGNISLLASLPPAIGRVGTLKPALSPEFLDRRRIIPTRVPISPQSPRLSPVVHQPNPPRQGSGRSLPPPPRPRFPPPPQQSFQLQRFQPSFQELPPPPPPSSPPIRFRRQ